MASSPVGMLRIPLPPRGHASRRSDRSAPSRRVQVAKQVGKLGVPCVLEKETEDGLFRVDIAIQSASGQW